MISFERFPGARIDRVRLCAPSQSGQAGSANSGPSSCLKEGASTGGTFEWYRAPFRAARKALILLDSSRERDSPPLGTILLTFTIKDLDERKRAHRRDAYLA
jgi:hypothetical protein